MILALFVFSYSAGILLFFNLSRLRLPIVPVLIMFAAFALVRFAQMARLRDWRSMALPFVVVLAFFGVSQLDLTHQNLNIRYFNMGVGFLTQSERSWAAAEALRESGDIARATLAERRAFEQRDFADEQFVRGLAHDPDYQRAADALRNSMLIRVVQLNQLEAWERAAEVGVGLVNRFPSFVPGHVVAGRALERAGRVGPARRVYRRALRLDPGNSAARLGLKRIEQEGPGSRAPGAD
jgi:tetratricopeptide (TPR) repeat protein